jgi:acetylornithine deacetylase/succinyl-diaminopimelate desuccinylase-like protein
VGTIRDGRLYARGAADDKGQVWIHLKALEACLTTRGTLPVNVVMPIEGEEEVGSTSLPGFVETHRARLGCDYIVISDTMMFAPGVPNILASMRWLAYFTLVDANGRVAIPGFYDEVREPSQTRRREIARLPFDEGRFAAELGISFLTGEEGYRPGPFRFWEGCGWSEPAERAPRSTCCRIGRSLTPPCRRGRK